MLYQNETEDPHRILTSQKKESQLPNKDKSHHCHELTVIVKPFEINDNQS